MIKITKRTKIGDVIKRNPRAFEILFRYGLHCVGCHVAVFESLEDGAKAHGLTSKQIDALVKELNKKTK